jgi:hypothetical protein
LKREWKPWKWIACPALIVVLFLGRLLAEDLSTATSPYNCDVINGVPTQRVKSCWGADNTVTDTSAANPFPVTIISGGSGGTQYVEDVASADAESMTLAGAVRRDTAASSSGTDGDYSTLNTDSTGRLWVNNSAPIVAGTAVIGAVGAATSGGYSSGHIVSANTNNATVLKASAGQLYSVQVFNLNAAARYIKFYNKATTPDPTADTVVKSILIPGNTAGAGVVIAWPSGVAFATGISYAVVTDVGNTGNTSVAANEIIVNIDYK